jgi:hypothetical protein
MELSEHMKNLLLSNFLKMAVGQNILDAVLSFLVTLSML